MPSSPVSIQPAAHPPGGPGVALRPVDQLAGILDPGSAPPGPVPAALVAERDAGPGLTERTIAIDRDYVHRMLADIVNNDDLSRYIL